MMVTIKARDHVQVHVRQLILTLEKAVVRIYSIKKKKKIC